MGVYAIDKLGDALAPLIGKEVELANNTSGEQGFVEAGPGWTGDADSEEVNLEEWTRVGKARVDQVKAEFVDHFKLEYSRLMRLKLGLTTAAPGDFDLFTAWLDLVERSELDFTNSFRVLSQFTSVDSPSFPAFLAALLAKDDTNVVTTNDRSDWTSFFKTYEARLSTEPADARATRRSRMDAHNPRFALRQWVLEETIKKLGTEGEAVGIEQLNRVLDLAQNPFEAYGEHEVGGVRAGEDESADACPSKEELERKRLCGVGSQDMLGFQCSCSS